jgi:hypothetical protein
LNNSIGFATLMNTNLNIYFVHKIDHRPYQCPHWSITNLSDPHPKNKKQ